MVILNILGAGAFILTCVALFMLRKQITKGWIVFLPSYVLQMIIFYHQKNWFLLIQMIVLFVLSLINYFEWEKNNGSIKH